MRKHTELCLSLAECKDTIYTEVPLGSVWLGQAARRASVSYDKKYMETEYGKIPIPTYSVNGVAIADVVNIRPSFTRFCVDIFEVKVSRADLMKDIKTEKYKKYLPFCHRFYYACESGICKTAEIPPECGLYIHGKISWRCTKGSDVSDIDIPVEFLMALIFYKKKNYVLKNKLFMAHQLQQYYGEQDVLIKKFGKDIGVKLWRMRQKDNSFMESYK